MRKVTTQQEGNLSHLALKFYEQYIFKIDSWFDTIFNWLLISHNDRLKYPEAIRSVKIREKWCLPCIDMTWNDIALRNLRKFSFQY
jgi:hypothetical protein